MAQPAPGKPFLWTMRHAEAVGIVGVLAAWAATQSCQIVGGYQSFQGHPCNVLPSSKLDSRKIGTLVLSKQSDGTCYWIDQTEVTVAQYGDFLNDAQPIDWDPNNCTWKTTPSNPANDPSDPCTQSTGVEANPFATNKPIRCIDWCDAEAYCTWAGKSLCDGFSNGSFDEPSDITDQWGNACSANALPYVTGTVPVEGACNVGLSEAGAECEVLLQQMACAPTYVDSFPECTSPSGAVDMIGNVAEWVVSCAASDGGPETECQTRGGSFEDSLYAQEAVCYYGAAAEPRDTRDRALGVRCCAALTAEEQSLVQPAAPH